MHRLAPLLLALSACASGSTSHGGRAQDGPAATGVDIDSTSTGSTDDTSAPQLDLPTPEPETLGTGEASTADNALNESTSTGEVDSQGANSSGDAASTSTGAGEAPASTSTGAEEAPGSTTDASTGAPDATSDASTSSGTTGELTDCPCDDDADNVCDLAPGSCSATLPGGLCDPNGDGAFFDGDWTQGWLEYQAKCE